MGKLVSAAILLLLVALCFGKPIDDKDDTKQKDDTEATKQPQDKGE